MELGAFCDPPLRLQASRFPERLRLVTSDLNLEEAFSPAPSGAKSKKGVRSAYVMTDGDVEP